MKRFFAVAFLCICFSLGAPGVSRAQSPAPSLPNAAGTSRPTFDPEAATQAWLASVPAEKRARSDTYFEGGYWLILWDFLLSAAISLLLLGSGISARLRDFAERTTGVKTFQVALYMIPYFVIISVLSFPLSVYRDYFREHAYGMATQSFGPWFSEQLIGAGVSLVGMLIVTMVLYAVFRRAPRSWWIWGTGASIVFLVIGLLIAPVFIEPLFNTYQPLTDPKISAPILAMASANEIPVHQVFEVDASRQTNRVSANVSGILGTARIALNDNLLKQCSLPEIRAVMAHEMGHYVLNHVWKLVLYFSVLGFVGFALLRFFFQAAVRRWGERWGVRGIADPAGFPLLALIFGTYFFLITPLTNTATRTTEREADAFGINTAREANGFAGVALKLGVYRKLDSGPIEEFIFFDHPSGRERIRMAMDWKAANLPAGDGHAEFYSRQGTLGEVAPNGKRLVRPSPMRLERAR